MAGQARPRPAGWAALVLGALLALAPAPAAAEIRIGGPFELVDQYGAARTNADFRGALMLVYFGFTHCPDACPTALSTIVESLGAVAQADAAPALRVVPVFISVDPERDTPEVLRDYAAQFDPGLVAMTGTPDALAEAGRAYGVFAAKVPVGGAIGYTIDHTRFIYLMGADGKYVAHFEGDVGVDVLADAITQAGSRAAGHRQSAER